MRLSTSQPTLFSLLAILLTSTHTVHAKPYPRDELKEIFQRAQARNSSIELRGECISYCGTDNQYCCTQGQACYTTNAIAACTDTAAQPTVAAEAGGSGYQVYTTTYVETDLQTITSTYTLAASPGIASPGVGTPTVSEVLATPTGSCAQGQDFCGGSLCCATNQKCLYQGQCGPGSASNSAFIRPTSNTVQTVTSTASATTTEPFSTPVSSSGSTVSASPSNKGLTGGAIAGIVIGVLLGLFLLFLVLACLCCKGILDGLFALLGCGRKRKVTEETYIASHHSHHGSSAPPPRRTWYGATVGPSRPEKKSNGIGFMGVAGILGTLAVILGLKRRHDRKEEKSEYGSASSYTYSEDYTTSASSASSDRRTRESGRQSRR